MVNAEMLRTLRHARGLSQTELAQRAGVCQQLVSKIERGASVMPAPKTVRGLARALGVSRSRLTSTTGFGIALVPLSQ